VLTGRQGGDVSDRKKMKAKTRATRGMIYDSTGMTVTAMAQKQRRPKTKARMRTMTEFWERMIVIASAFKLFGLKATGSQE
jgi:hypothetical protein